MPRLAPARRYGSQRELVRAGFTLVELLVTLTLLGLLGTIVSQMMMDQQRFYQRTNEQMAVRRELRSALSMLPADLRSISSVGGDIGAFSPSMIRFRATIGASIICSKPNPSTIDLPPLDMARTTLTAWHDQPTVGDTVFAFRADSMGAGGDSWTAHRIESVTLSTAYCPGSPYIDGALDAGKTRFRVAVTPAMHDSVKVGAAVRFARNTEYRIVTSPTGRHYVGRSEFLGGAWTGATPIAGPFLAPSDAGTGGIRFVMYDSTGVEIAPGGNPLAISRIDLTLRGKGASSSGPVAGKTEPVDSIALRIALRNRQ